MINNTLLKTLQEKKLAEDGWHLGVTDGDNQIVCFLELISTQQINREEIISEMTSWRQKYREYFFSQFLPTKPKTYSWLRHVYLSNPKHFLFLIREDNYYIGNLGFKIISDIEVEIDNVVRAKDSSCQKIMYFSLRKLIYFCFHSLHAELCTLSVFSDNYRAINLYTRLGFEKIKEYPLFLSVKEDTIVYGTEAQGNATNRKMLKMQLLPINFV